MHVKKGIINKMVGFFCLMCLIGLILKSLEDGFESLGDAVGTLVAFLIILFVAVAINFETDEQIKDEEEKVLREKQLKEEEERKRNEVISIDEIAQRNGLSVEDLKVVMIEALKQHNYYDPHAINSLSSTLNANHVSCRTILFEIINSDAALKSEFKRQQLLNKTKPDPQPTTVIVESSVDRNVARCPRCNSTSLSANKKGLGGAVVGGILFGPTGALIGASGSGKVTVTCLKCGKKFKAGKGK